MLKDIPEMFEGKNVLVEIESIDPEEKKSLEILRQEKCQTLPLTRGADRYYIDFTDEEAEILNSIPVEKRMLAVNGKKLVVPLDIRPYSMYLLKIKLDE